MPLNPKEKKLLRTIGHKLKPIVTIAGQGLTDNVQMEINRALDDHELIKVKINVGDRQLKVDMINRLCERKNTELVQAIGNTALLLRKAKEPNPKLSNLLR